MPIDTVLDGDELRTVSNSTGVIRIGFDGSSCYLYLRDGAAIEIKPLITNNLKPELKFIHRTFLPTDKSSLKKTLRKLTAKHERNKKTS